MTQGYKKSCANKLFEHIQETKSPVYWAVVWTIEIWKLFANGPGDQGSVPGRVIPNTQKMVLDAALLNTQHYEIRINGKVAQTRERSSALLCTLVL